MISSTSNPRVKWVRGLQSQRRQRQTEGQFVAEGFRWAGEFLSANRAPVAVFHTDHLNPQERGVVNRLASLGAAIEVVSDEVMAAMSDTQAPQAILLVAEIPELPAPDPVGLAVIADQLSDPGNLGTLLRTCLAARVDVLYLTEGSVDPYNPKVVRGAMGAQLHLCLRQVRLDLLAGQLEGLQSWLAETDKGLDYLQVDWRQPTALLIGSEAHGARPALRQIADGLTHIPISGPSDSLNAAVAAAVILFEIRRQRSTA